MTIANKIAKIIAKADSTTNPEEADTFMAKAHAMMEAHGLSLLDLGRLDSEDPIGTSRDCASVSASYGCARAVATQLASYYGCELVYTAYKQENKFKFHVCGRESARITFQLMFPYVWRQVADLARKDFKAGNHKTRMSALNAVANALTLRIARLVAEQKDRRKEDLAGKGLNALVPVDLIEQELRNAFPRARVGRASKMRTNESARKAADKVSFNRQTNAAPGTKRIAG